MTVVVVEFYDAEVPIHNLVSTIANIPERMILVGNLKQIQRAEPKLREFLDELGYTGTELECRSAPEHELKTIVQVLEGILADYPDCCMDLTGGGELYTAAAGMAYALHGAEMPGFQLHQYNIRTGRIYDCDQDGKLQSDRIPGITVRQHIRLHGGRVMDASECPDGTWTPEQDATFIDDVNAMWEIARKDFRSWNSQLTILAQIMAADISEDPLRLTIPVGEFNRILEKHGGRFCSELVVLPLLRAGLITDYTADDEYFELEYRSLTVRHCLEKAGTVLELKIFLAAQEAEDADGIPVYDDAETGVFIDWDGVRSGNKDDTENEIDVILMRGLVPVFISCKSGMAPVEELYKLDTVARRFGGRYVKKVLIGTELEQRLGEKWPAFRERAEDMGIQLLPEVGQWSDEKLRSELAKLR